MITQEHVEKQKEKFGKELESSNREILIRFPVHTYLDDVKLHFGHGRFSNLNRWRRPKGIFQKIESQYGLSMIPLYLKYALLCAIGESLEQFTQKKLPEDIIGLYHEWFECIIRDFSLRSDDYYHHRCYSFGMDIKVCTLRNIPVGGAWIVEISRAGLRPLISGGPGQSLRYMRYLAFRTCGISPFYILHTVPRFLCQFNRDQMNRSYLRIAALLNLNPHIKGIYRRSWFLDPKLEQISPELAYLRQVPQQNGATFFDAGSTKRDTQFALAMSPKRKKYYAEGKYRPRVYAYIWPRKDLLEWADKTI